MHKLWDILPYALGILSTIIALKKNWFAVKFGMKKNKIQLQADAEDVESKSLDNVDKSLQIFKDMLSEQDKHYKARLEEQEVAFNKVIEKLDLRIQELETVIEVQAKSLKYYIKKYGDIKH